MLTSFQLILKTLSWTIVHSFWQIAVITLIAALLGLITRNRTSAFRFRLFTISLLCIFISVISTFFLVYSKIRSSNAVLGSAIQSQYILEQTTTEKNSYSLVNNQYPSGILSQVDHYIDQYLPFIVIIWLLGVMVSLLRLAGGIGHIHYLKTRMNFPVDEFWESVLANYTERFGINRKVTLLESALVTSPLVIGHIKPVILFPISFINKMTVSEVEAVISHELAHIMRNDYLINILMSVLQSLFYYHPAIWWLTKQAKTERENSCDDIAIEFCGDKVLYAKSLVMVQQMVSAPQDMAMAFSGDSIKSQFGKRIVRLLAPDRVKINYKENFSVLCFICSLLLVLASFAPGKNIKAIYQKSLQSEHFSANRLVNDTAPVRKDALADSLKKSNDNNMKTDAYQNADENKIKKAQDQITRKQNEINQTQAEIKIKQEEIQKQQAEIEKRKVKIAKFEAGTKQLLKREGLWNGGPISLKISQRDIILGGKVLPDKIHQEVLKLYEQATGEKFDKYKSMNIEEK
jgi:beta-lactamase regulating signal transducer with metallopeptidase domain